MQFEYDKSLIKSSSSLISEQQGQAIVILLSKMLNAFLHKISNWLYIKKQNLKKINFKLNKLSN